MHSIYIWISRYRLCTGYLTIIFDNQIWFVMVCSTMLLEDLDCCFLNDKQYRYTWTRWYGVIRLTQSTGWCVHMNHSLESKIENHWYLHNHSLQAIHMQWLMWKLWLTQSLKASFQSWKFGEIIKSFTEQKRYTGPNIESFRKYLHQWKPEKDKFIFNWMTMRPFNKNLKFYDFLNILFE